MALTITSKGEASLAEIGLKYLYPEVFTTNCEVTDAMIEDALNRTKTMVREAVHLSGEVGTINGHFWVERDGKVVDTTLNTKGFKKNETNRNQIALRFGATMGANLEKMMDGFKNPEYVYVEAPPITQQIMIKSILSPFQKVFNGNMDYAMECLSAIDAYKPQYGCCNMNAIIEQLKDGGKIKFGSLGYKVFGVTDWIYGNEIYKTIKEFRDYNTPKEEEVQKFGFIRNMIVACDPDKKQLAKFELECFSVIGGM
jgi:hypothetical protein